MLRSSHDNDELQELIERFDLELWLDEEGIDYSVKAGSSGEQLNIKTCPRCGGSDRKVFINRDTGLGNCFHGSCVGEPGFNKFTFVKHYTGESGRVVKSILALQAEEQGWRPKRERQTVKTVIPDNIELPKSIALPHKGRSLKYLTQRGFTPETVGLLGLRYCQEGYYWYTDFEGKKRRQDYSKRVIIPVYDATGKMVTFQGRDITSTAERKYLFPPQLSSTGRYLYNAHNVTIQTHLIIGEGVFDVAAIHQAITQYKLNDICAAVGSFGIAFSTGPDQQLSELEKLVDKGIKSVTFLWDGGVKATGQAFKCAIEIASWLGIDVSVGVLPDNKDPNEVEPSVVIDAIARAKPATKMNYIKYMGKRRA